MSAAQTTLLGPCDLQVTLVLADSLARNGQIGLAVEHYRSAAASFIARGEAHNALATYALLARLIPQCMHTQGMLAKLHRTLGRPYAAAEIYERIGRAHIAARRWSEAKQVYAMLVDTDPVTVPRRVQLAELCVVLGQRREAIEHFDVAARQLYAAARTHEYLWVAQRLLTQDPEHAQTLRDLVRVRLHLGDFAGAAGHLQTLLRARPCDDAGRELVGDCFAARGRFDMACRAMVMLGAELRDRGVHAWDEAKRVLVRGVAWFPCDRYAQRALADLEQDMARLAERDFEEERITGVIDFVPDAELLGHGAVDDATTNVVALRQVARPTSRPPPPAPDGAKIIYGRFARGA